EDERRARLLRLRARYQACGDLRSVYRCEDWLASCAGSMSGRIAMLETAIAHARALNETYMPCQMLGEPGSAYLETGQRDRGLDCYEEGLRIATHCRFPDQMVRLLMFCAHYYVGQGRPALAMNLMHEAQRVSRELGGGTDLRLAVESTGVFSGL